MGSFSERGARVLFRRVGREILFFTPNARFSIDFLQEKIFRVSLFFEKKFSRLEEEEKEELSPTLKIKSARAERRKTRDKRRRR